MMSLRFVKSVLLLTMLIGLSACAAGRSVVSIPLPNSESNPVNGVDIKLVAVTDNRVFQVKPGVPEVPSLSEDEEINSGIKARAYARKRGDWGQGLGDVILPEGETVVGVMTQYMQSAFQNAGYRVLSEGDAGYDSAIPVTVRIVQFWCWVELTVGLSNISEIIIRAPDGKLEDVLIVRNKSVHKAFLSTDEAWQQCATLGMQEISAKVSAELRKLQ